MPILLTDKKASQLTFFPSFVSPIGNYLGNYRRRKETTGKRHRATKRGNIWIMLCLRNPADERTCRHSLGTFQEERKLQRGGEPRKCGRGTPPPPPPLIGRRLELLLRVCAVHATQACAARARGPMTPRRRREGDGLPDDDEPFSKMTGWKSEG